MLPTCISLYTSKTLRLPAHTNSRLLISWVSSFFANQVTAEWVFFCLLSQSNCVRYRISSTWFFFSFFPFTFFVSCFFRESDDILDGLASWMWDETSHPFSSDRTPISARYKTWVFSNPSSSGSSFQFSCWVQEIFWTHCTGVLACSKTYGFALVHLIHSLTDASKRPLLLARGGDYLDHHRVRTLDPLCLLAVARRRFIDGCQSRMKK